MGRGVIPKRWKSAIIKSQLEAGKDPKDVGSYRPVTHTNILCKIFEIMTI